MARSLRVARIGLLAAICVAAMVAVPSGAAVPSSPTVAAAFGHGIPGFVVAAAPDSLPNADLAGEPSLGLDWKSDRALFMANTSTYRLSFDNRASPPSVTWSDASSPYSLFNVDPILASDAATGETLAGGDDGACAVMSRTVDDGESWSAGAPCTGVIDHPTVGLGPFHGSPPPGATGSTAAYFCQQYPVLNQCARSTDGGETWSPGVTVTGCTGLFGHVKVSADGTAYVPSKNCAAGSDTGVGGFLSADNGLTWSPYVIPGAPTPDRGFDPSVAASSGGTVFEAWSAGGTAHPMVAVSGDSAAHWSQPVDLAGTVNPPLVGTTFDAVVAGGPGRAAVAFLGTRHQPKQGVSPLDDPGAVWDLYLATTYDNGRTWTTAQVTTHPVQRGGISDGGVTSTSNRNLLDFIDAGVTRDGRVVIAFADGCTARVQCTDAATSTDQHATVAYQSRGRGLFAAFDR